MTKDTYRRPDGSAGPGSKGDGSAGQASRAAAETVRSGRAQLQEMIGVHLRAAGAEGLTALQLTSAIYGPAGVSDGRRVQNVRSRLTELKEACLAKNAGWRRQYRMPDGTMRSEGVVIWTGKAVA